MKCVAYYRVSDIRQERSGLGLDAQKEMVKHYLDDPHHKRELIAEFEETGSGRKAKRPKLEAALALCKKKRAVLVIAKLDRLARNTAFVSKLMEDETIKFVALDLPVKPDPLHTHIYAAFAEHEARRIRERIKDALKQARERGRELGGKRYLRDWEAKSKNGEKVYLRDERGRRIRWDPRKAMSVARERRSSDAEKHRARLATTVNALRGKDMTLTAIGAELKKLNLEPPRGGEWYPAQVARLLKPAKVAKKRKR